MGAPQHDPPSFEDAFSHLYADARSVAFRLLGDRVPAEDAAAEAIARALVAWDRVERLDHRRAWVLRVTANVAIDAMRKGRAPLGSPGQAERFEDGAVLRVDLRDALARLPRRQREVVTLRWLGDLSEREVAAVLGLSLSAVKTHAGRGVRQLRSQFGGGLPDVAF